MMQLLYRIVYSSGVNYLVRNINKMLYPVLPIIRMPPSGKLTLSLKSGKKLKFYTNQTDHVSFIVFWNGLYKYEYVEMFEDIIGKCRGFLDIGVNGGLYSLVAASTSEDIQILAFDPTEAASFYFKKNIAANGFEKSIDFRQMAMSDKDGEATFFNVRYPKYKYLEHNLGGSSSFVVQPKEFTELKVELTSVDQFIANKRPDFKVDFVKIDAEGAEPMILFGMKKTILKDQPIVVCEVLHDEVLKDMESELKAHEYAFYFHLKDGLKQVDSLKRKDEFDDVRNCFFVPKSRKHLIEKWVID